MAHIHTNPGEHDHTASAFIVRTDKLEPQLLLHQHKLLGKLLQPGGHVELHENPWQSVLHEIAEETGYRTSQLKILQPSLRIRSLSSAALHPYSIAPNTHDFGNDSTHRHTDNPYAFVVSEDPIGRPDDGESTIFRWVTYDELSALSDDEIVANVREIGQFVLKELLYQWEPVESATFKA